MKARILVLVVTFLVSGCQSVGGPDVSSIDGQIDPEKLSDDLEHVLQSALMGSQDEIMQLVYKHRDSIVGAIEGKDRTLSTIDGLGPGQRAIIGFINDPDVWALVARMLREYQPYHGFSPREMEQVRRTAVDFYVKKITNRGEDYAIDRLLIVSQFVGL